MKKLFFTSFLISVVFLSLSTNTADASPTVQSFRLKAEVIYLTTVDYGNFEVGLYVDETGKVVAAEVYDTSNGVVYNTTAVTGKYAAGHVNAVVHFDNNGDNIIKIINYAVLL